MTVSLCMILLNEQDLVGECLRSAQPVVDEIVALVDDRTTDATATICRRFGARVEPYAWQDDFAAARNASIELATGDWILVLDADDTLLPAGRRAVKAAVGLRDVRTSLNVHGFVFEISERDRRGRELFQAQSSGRLFPRSRELRYAGIVHEEVAYRGERAATRWAMVDNGPHIAHVGYDRGLFATRGKDERNLRLLVRRAELESDNPYVLRDLARHHYFMRRYANAEHYASAALAHPGYLAPEHRRELLTMLRPVLA